MEQYADVVLTIEGKCWRMVMPDGAAKTRHPTNCPEPVSGTGRHQWRNGAWVKVWSCDEHADALVGIRRF